MGQLPANDVTVVPLIVVFTIWRDDLPPNRGCCENGPRPCPWIRCRYHLWSDVGKKAPLPTHSCALDVADEGPHTLEYVANLLGLTRERVRQIEAAAIRRAKSRAPLVMSTDE